MLWLEPAVSTAGIACLPCQCRCHSLLPCASVSKTIDPEVLLLPLLCRVKSVMVREWMVELTTASSDLNDDRRWEEEYCAKADKCACSHVTGAE